MLKKLSIFLITVLLLTSCLQPFALTAQAETSEGETTDYARLNANQVIEGLTGSPDIETPQLNYSISNFESTSDVWGSGYGDKSPVSVKYERTDTEYQDGSFSGKLSADFNTGDSNYVYMEKKFTGGIDIKQLAFWIKAPDLKRVAVRTVDSTGQIFQHYIDLAATSNWQQASLTSMTSGLHWNGANDGIWHGSIQKIMIILDEWEIRSGQKNSTIFIDNVRAYVNTSQFGYTISSFEAAGDLWATGYGDASPVGVKFERTDTEHKEGSCSGKLSADFTTGTSNYVYMQKSFAGDIDTEKLSFWIKAPDLKAVAVRTVDSTGQIFQTYIDLEATPDWQLCFVTSMTSSLHWGGQNDGVWHGPIKKMMINLERYQIRSGAKTATIYFDDIQAKLGANRPDLKVDSSQFGNVFQGDEKAEFSILTAGDQLKWKVTDLWGETKQEGQSATDMNGICRLSFPQLDKGYYEIELSAYKSGSLLKTVKNSFAVLGEKLDLSAVNDSPFGISVHFGQPWAGWPLELFSLMSKAGIKNLRDEMYWNNVETAKGVYTFSQGTENFMKAAKDYSIDPLIILSYTNQFYDGYQTPYTPAGLKAFANYGKAILDHYGSQIKSVEVYNEYNITAGGPANKDPANYFKMLKETYNTVKAAHPDVKVVGPVTSHLPLEWIETLFKQQDADGPAIQYMDDISVHPYRYPAKPEGLDNETAALQSLIQNYNSNEKKPIWITELGWPTQEDSTGISEEMQAAYLIRSTVQFLSEGVEKLYWYDLMNDGVSKTNSEHNFGIVHNAADPMGKCTPKPAYVAYSVMTRQLTGAQFQKTENSDGFYSYLFEKGSEPIHVMWSQEPVQVTLEADAPMVVTDIMGRQKTVTPVNGKIYYTLSQDPIFVSGNVASITKGGIFSIQARDALVGVDADVQLVVDNTGSNQALTAEFTVKGQIVEVTAEAGQKAVKTIMLPAYTTAQTVSISGEVKVSGSLVGVVSTAFKVTEFMSSSVKHVLTTDGDALRIQIKNFSSRPYELTRAEWKAGNLQAVEDPKLTVQGNETGNYDLQLTGLANGTYTYEVKLFSTSDGKELVHTGKLILPAEQHPIIKKSISLEEPPAGLPDEPYVHLSRDANYSNLSGYVPGNDLDGDLWLNWDKNYFYLTASISDAVHSQPSNGGNIWQGDSIQLAVSSGAPGEQSQMYEYGLALTKNGPELYRWMGMAGAEAGVITGSDVNLQIVRDEQEKKTHYRLALPWKYLSPVVPEDGLMGFSVLVNDSNGAGRRGWAEWGSGIGLSKNPAQFKAMTLISNKSTNADLTGISVNGQPIENFAADWLEYAVELPAKTTTHPAITAEAADANAAVEITQAASLPGSAVIKVTAGDGTTTKTYTVALSVGVELEAVTLTADKTILKTGETARLSLNGIMSDGTQADMSKAQIVYASDNEQAAKVDENGTVTAYGEGIAHIKAAVLLHRVAKESEIQILVDSTPPVTTAGTGGNAKNGWYFSDAVVTLSAADNLSGIERTEYRLGDSGEWSVYTGPVTLSQEGKTVVQYRSIDRAGNAEAEKQLDVQIDKTAPDFSLLVNGQSIKDGAVFDDDLPLIFQVGDNLSGVSFAQLSIDGTAYQIDPQTQSGIEIDLAGKTGSHAVAVISEDTTGNSKELNFTITVTTSMASLRNLLDKFYKNGELGGPLTSQLTNNLDQAQQKLEKGRPEQAAQHMEDFIKHLNNEALSSNASADAKRVLNADAEALIELLSGKANN